MADLQLTRTPGDRRLYALEGVGTLRLRGWLSRAATADAYGLTWEIGRSGLWKPVIQAADAAGAVVGEFAGRALHRGGTLRWSGRELALRSDSFWRERYALVEGDHQLATIEGKGWGKRPVNVTLDDSTEIDPGLLLFAVFVVRALAEDAQAAAGAGAASAGATAASG